jgi:hypothetical protein
VREEMAKVSKKSSNIPEDLLPLLDIVFENSARRTAMKQLSGQISIENISADQIALGFETLNLLEQNINVEEDLQGAHDQFSADKVKREQREEKIDEIHDRIVKLSNKYYSIVPHMVAGRLGRDLYIDETEKLDKCREHMEMLKK